MPGRFERGVWAGDGFGERVDDEAKPEGLIGGGVTTGR